MLGVLYAMGSAGGASQQGQGNPFGFLIMMALIFGIFYFLTIRPQQKKQKERQEMISKVEKGDKVITSGGIYGMVVGTKEKTLVIKVADNVKVEFARSAVSRVEKKAEQA
ncbi:MAG: preprotein translocase subunit YajC [bacterium]|nr:preprotein translocase subunit YajC [bacterium]